MGSVISGGGVYNGLTLATFRSFSHTCISLFEMTKYILNMLKPQYLLLGKFQTDPLEKRFGCYRQMSGSNYHISLQELLESEKKLRVKNLLRLTKKSGIRITDLTVPESMGEMQPHSLPDGFFDVAAKELDLCL